MYETYWQLEHKPFENAADSRLFFPGESHQSALLKLRYAVENRRGGALLSGAAGTGKTYLISMLRESLGDNYAPFVHLVYPQMSPAELMAYLADELDGGANADQTVPESIRRIQTALRTNAKSGRHAVVVIDEAHLLESSPMLETLRMLLNFGPEESSAMTLLLLGQPGILPVLDRTPQLEERLGVKCLLRPFTANETGEYVAHRLQLAGAGRTIVEDEAVPTLYELTRGVPRQINRLCDLALLVGFAEEQSTLSAANFEAVCRELVAVVPE